jgi:hypothetical protein
MTSIAVETTYTTGLTLRCWPSDDTVNYVTLTESATGLYTGTLDDALGSIWYAFVGTATPTTWDDHVDGGPVKVFDLNLANLATAATGGVSVTVTQPVSTDGNLIYPIIIGDDYLASNSRAFTWDIPAITGFVVGTSTCKFGGEYVGKTATYTWSVNGTVADLGTGYWRLSFDVAKTVTADLLPAYYVWSVEITNAGGTEITRVRSGKTVQLVEKQT